MLSTHVPLAMFRVLNISAVFIPCNSYFHSALLWIYNNVFRVLPRQCNIDCSLSWTKDCGLYPCSIKTMEVSGNPSPKPKRFPETREMSQGRSPRDILRVEGNLKGRCGGFPNNSRVLVEYVHIHHQFVPRECIGKSFPVDREELAVLNPILSCKWW